MPFEQFGLSSFTIAFYLYLAAAILALGALVTGNRWLMRAAWVAVGLGAVALSVLIGNRWAVGGHPPLSGLFDAVIFFSWTTVVACIVAEILFRTRWLTLLVGVTETIFLAYAADLDPGIKPLMPVLKSTWLTIHVIVYMVGYGIMTIAFFSSLCYYFYYFTRRGGPAEKDLTAKFDNLTYRFIAFGFPLLTAGVLTGAVWANRTWGRYWGWDPKETWSLITWIIYATFLHLRYWSRFWKITRERRSLLLNWLAILGFAALVFTFLLLKLLPSATQSKHVYL